MEIRLEAKNVIAQFHTYNQGREVWSRMACSLFAPCVNLKYNCGIALTEDDIQYIMNIQIKNNKFDINKGGYGKDGVNAIYDFIKENALKRNWKIPNLIEFKEEDEKELLKWIERGFSAMIGIKVSKEFSDDVIDGKIEKYEDYTKYKGNMGHFTNLLTFSGRFTKPKEEWKDYILDSYAFNKKNRDWMYECKKEQVLQSFDFPTKYIFF